MTVKQSGIHAELGGETVLMHNFNSDTIKGVTEVAGRENLTCKKAETVFQLSVMNYAPESKVHSILGELEK